MDGVFVFEKSFDDRMNDFEEVLFERHPKIDPSRIRKEWSIYFDVVLEPNGWKAVWKIPRERCDDFDIPYPNVVLVYVDYIDYEKLSARVKILAVHGDIDLPEYVDADLMHLHPTVGQDKTFALDIPVTAEALEMFQFFYNNIWLPWDENDDAWTRKNVENRLNLHYNLNKGTMSRSQINHLKSILNEARILQSHGENITEPEQSFTSEFREICTIERRLVQLRNEFECFEHQSIKNICVQSSILSEEIESPKSILVCVPKTCDEHLEYIQQCKSYVAQDEQAATVTNLYEALKIANRSTKILLGNGTHKISKYSQGCQYVGSLIGVQDLMKTIVTIEPHSVAVFEVSGEEMLLKNIKISVDSISSAIIVHKGRLVLIDCLLESSGTSHTRQGIVVHPQGELIMKNCDLIGFSIGIVCKEISNVVLESCNISQCQIGIKINDHTKLAVSTSTISESTNCAIHFETEMLTSKVLSGNDFKILLTKSEDLKIDSITFMNNAPNDVHVISKSKQIPFEEIVTPSRKHKSGLIDL